MFRTYSIRPGFVVAVQFDGTNGQHIVEHLQTVGGPYPYSVAADGTVIPHTADGRLLGVGDYVVFREFGQIDWVGQQSFTQLYELAEPA